MAKSPISNSIRKLRFNADEMTQAELADKVGVTRQTILAIENAKYSPSLELAFRIARVFDVPLEEVFSFEGEIIRKKEVARSPMKAKATEKELS